MPPRAPNSTYALVSLYAQIAGSELRLGADCGVVLWGSWASTASPERAICARMSESVESLPLPKHPLLAAWASALNDAGYWAEVWDADWRYVFETDELRLSYRDMGAPTTPPIGSHFFSAEVRHSIESRSVTRGRRGRPVERGS